MRVWLIVSALALALMGCEQNTAGSDPSAQTGGALPPPASSFEPTEPAAPAEPVEPAPNITAQDELAATLPLPGETPSPQAAENVSHVYMALQPDAGGGPLSVVFAIDRSRDNTPQDEPAVRLTPENGECNPQQLRRFAFPEEARAKPTFGPEEVRRGISARELPNFMAIAVTSEMMQQGLIIEPEESKPQNVCTRKLWELMIVRQSPGQG